MTIKISNSEIQTFKSCRRQWYFRYYRELAVKRYDEAPDGPRQLGTKVHSALEAFYENGVDPVSTIAELYSNDIDFYRERDEPDKVLAIQKEFDMADAMVAGYVEHIEETGIDQGLTLISTEAVVEYPLDDQGFSGYALRGKLDARFLRDFDGARLFMDHKTVQEFTTPQKLLPIDEQMKFYHMLDWLDAGGEIRTDGALYNMLRKVKRTATAKPPFYMRLEKGHNQAELDSMWLRTMRIVEEIRKTREQLDAGGDPNYICPPRPSRDCTWICDFFRVCPMFDDGSNAEGFLEERYEIRDPHERYNDAATEAI